MARINDLLKKVKIRFVALSFFLFFASGAVLPVLAQLTINGIPPVYDSRSKTYLLTVPEEVFGSSYTATAVLDADVSLMVIGGKMVTTRVNFPVVKGDTCYSFVFKRNGVTTSSTLYFTYLPILTMTGKFSDDYVVGPVRMIAPDDGGVRDYQARVKWAGSSTDGKWTHKRNYHLKFIDSSGEKMDVSFFGLRNDNHWRLDAGTVDMLRFRNKTAHELWADFGARPYYADLQPKARTWTRGGHVEMFLNDEYRGFYNMMEYMDRKQMKLKKYEVNADAPQGSDSIQMHGMMWKAKDRTAQTLFVSVTSTPPDNTQDSWCGFEQEYPDFDDVNPTDYTVLYNLVKFVCRTRDNVFVDQADEFLDIPVLVNYYVFLQTLFAIDNTDKNIVWGCYDSAADKKMTIAVWDLDATAGQHYIDKDGYYRADAIQPENDFEQTPTSISGVSQSRLLQRLKILPDFMLRATNCYWRLRQTILHPDSLVGRYEATYRRLEACGALGRESQRWSGDDDIAYRDIDFEDEFHYLADWLRRRIAYLDTHTFACLRGDVNGDGVVDVVDVAALIDYTLGKSDGVNLINADVNIDDEVDVADVVCLVDLVLIN